MRAAGSSTSTATRHRRCASAGDLAPRDVVANAVHAAIARTGHPCVYLDVTGVGGARRIRGPVPDGHRGIDGIGRRPVVGRIPVVPGAHYLCGGVVTDTSGATSVPGLLARPVRSPVRACTEATGSPPTAFSRALWWVAGRPRSRFRVVTRRYRKSRTRQTARYRAY